MGETTIRLGKVTERCVSGEKRPFGADSMSVGCRKAEEGSCVLSRVPIRLKLPAFLPDLQHRIPVDTGGLIVGARDPPVHAGLRIGSERSITAELSLELVHQLRLFLGDLVCDWNRQILCGADAPHRLKDRPGKAPADECVWSRRMEQRHDETRALLVHGYPIRSCWNENALTNWMQCVVDHHSTFKGRWSVLHVGEAPRLKLLR